MVDEGEDVEITLVVNKKSAEFGVFEKSDEQGDEVGRSGE